MNKDHYPKRIVCLTKETTETLYLLGEQDRIVGISGFTVRPKITRKEKPKVSTFIDANIDEIISLEPDLVIGFSDIQADIARSLIEKGVTVWVNNYRSVQGIMNMIVQLGALVGKEGLALHLVKGYKLEIERIKLITSKWQLKPKIYFEEWYDPIISGIEWVSEIIELTGGTDVYRDYQDRSLAKNRIIKDPDEIIEKNPDIILASWCGKMFKKEKMLKRNGWDAIKAIQDDQVFEIRSDVILQPGPAALSEGIQQIHQIFQQWVEKQNK